MSKTILLTISLILAMFVCLGCNTVKGLGQDISCVGQAAADVVD